VHYRLRRRCLYVLKAKKEYQAKRRTKTDADTFTIRAIGQDDFSDVPMPDAPVSPGHAPHMSAVKSAGSSQ